MQDHTHRDGILFILKQNITTRAIRALICQASVLSVSYFIFIFCFLVDGPQAVEAFAALVALCCASMVISTAWPMISLEKVHQRLLGNSK